MTRIIAISNEKGGVGKSTTAVNIAHALAVDGQKVLLIDFDSQGSASVALGVDPTDGTYNLLIERQPVAELVIEARPNLDVLPSDHSLAEARDIIAARYNTDDPERRKRALRVFAQSLQNQLVPYDYVFIDNSPSISVLTLNALMAADQLLVPVSADFLSTFGTGQHLETLDLIGEMGGTIELAYIVPTRFDGRTNRARRILEILQENFGDLVTAPIRVNTHIAESSHYGLTIFEHAPKSNGAADYAQLAKVIHNG